MTADETQAADDERTETETRALCEDRERRVASKAGRAYPVLFHGAVALCVGLCGVALVGRGSPTFLGWQLARAHARIESHPPLRLSLWTSSPYGAQVFFDAQGTETPLVPGPTDGLDLVGVRYSLLADRVVAHAVYGSEDRLVSVFFLDGPARIGRGHHATVDGFFVAIERIDGKVMAIVARTPEEIGAFERAFARRIATGPSPQPGLRR